MDRFKATASRVKTAITGIDLLQSIRRRLPGVGRQGTYRSSSLIVWGQKCGPQSGNPVRNEDFIHRSRAEVRRCYRGRGAVDDGPARLPALGLAARLHTTTGYLVFQNLRRVRPRPATAIQDGASGLTGRDPVSRADKLLGEFRRPVAQAKAVETKGPAGSPLVTRRQAWLQAARRERDGEPDAGTAMRRAAVAHDKLVAQLATDVAAARASQDGSAAAKYRMCASTALAATLPDLSTSSPAPAEVAERARVVDLVVELDRQLSGAAGGVHGMHVLLEALCDCGRIREYSQSPDAAARLLALGDLALVLHAMVDSVRDGGNGSALNRLIGLSAGLDTAVIALRTKATRTLLGQQLDHDHKRGPTDEQSMEAGAQAQAAVTLDVNVLKSRQRLQLALQAEGAPVDMVRHAATFRATEEGRESFGRFADKVGLCIDAVAAHENAKGASPATRKVEQALNFRAQKARRDSAPVAEESVARLPQAGEMDQSGSSSSDTPTVRLHPMKSPQGGGGTRTADTEPTGRGLLPRPTEHGGGDDSDASSDTDSDTDTSPVRVHVYKTPERQRVHLPAGRERKTGHEPEHAGSDVSDDHVIDMPPDPQTVERDARTLRLARDGMTSEAGTSRAYKDMNDVMSAVRPRLRKLNASLVGGGKDEDKAQRLGDKLVRKLLQTDDPAVGMKSVAADKSRQAALEGQLKGRFRKFETKGDTTVGRETKGAGGGAAFLEEDQFALKTQDRLAVASERLAQLEDRLALCRTVLSGRGITSVGAARAQACRNMRDALTRLAQLDAGQTSPEAIRDLERLRNALAGFDATELRGPLLATGAAMNEATLRELAADPHFLAAVDAVVFIAEGQPLAEALEEDISANADILDKNLQMRREALGEEYPVLCDAVRAATLAEIGADPISLFDPSAKADKIKARLQSWGVPVELLRPEIDTMLSESFGPDELSVWLRESNAQVDEAEGPQPPEEPAPATDDPDAPQEPEDRTERGLARAKARLDHAKKELLDGVDRLQLSARVRYSTGSRGELASGTWLLPQSTTWQLGGKLAVNSVLGLEVGRGADAYEIVLRSGWEYRAGMTTVTKVASLDLPVTPKVETLGSGDGARSKNHGVVLRFPNSEAGLKQMKQALEVLIDKDPIEPGDLPEGTTVCSMTETRTLVRGGGGGRVGVEFGLTESLDGKGTLPAAMGSVRGTLSGLYQEIEQTARSANGSVSRRITEGGYDLTAGVGAIVRTGSRVTDGKTSLSGDVYERGAWNSATVRFRQKVVRAANGFIADSTEVDRQIFLVPGVPARTWAYARAGAEFRKQMEELRKSKDPQDQRVAVEVDAMIDQMVANQMLSVASKLDERVMAAANRKIAQANALRSGAVTTDTPADALRKAEALDAEVQGMLDDEDNYILHRVRVMDQYDRLASDTWLDLGVVRASRLNERSGVHPIMDARTSRPTAIKNHDAGVGGVEPSGDAEFDDFDTAGGLSFDELTALSPGTLLRINGQDCVLDDVHKKDKGLIQVYTANGVTLGGAAERHIDMRIRGLADAVTVHYIDPRRLKVERRDSIPHPTEASTTTSVRVEPRADGEAMHDSKREASGTARSKETAPESLSRKRDSEAELDSPPKKVAPSLQPGVVLASHHFDDMKPGTPLEFDRAGDSTWVPVFYQSRTGDAITISVEDSEALTGRKDVTVEAWRLRTPMDGGPAR